MISQQCAMMIMMLLTIVAIISIASYSMFLDFCLLRCFRRHLFVLVWKKCINYCWSCQLCGFSDGSNLARTRMKETVICGLLLEKGNKISVNARNKRSMTSLCGQFTSLYWSWYKQLHLMTIICVMNLPFADTPYFLLFRRRRRKNAYLTSKKKKIKRFKIKFSYYS